ncbi:hypothetical protein KAZ01_03985 [Candidatus Gracilibacteria bacterium]|nr:hypothetical protein [Candidatus Gracilibacteria bacterium]
MSIETKKDFATQVDFNPTKILEQQSNSFLNRYPDLRDKADNLFNLKEQRQDKISNKYELLAQNENNETKKDIQAIQNELILRKENTIKKFSQVETWQILAG